MAGCVGMVRLGGGGGAWVARVGPIREKVWGCWGSGRVVLVVPRNPVRGIGSRLLLGFWLAVAGHALSLLNPLSLAFHIGLDSSSFLPSHPTIPNS